MATPRDPSPSHHSPRGHIDPSAPWPLRALMAVFRFLSSLKLAVISIASLAAVLARATFFEKDYGGPAVQEYIYQSVGFSILLAFLATNILCAALIRFPWKRRQTGFVVTHAGLLILIFGSWWGLQHSDEGQAGAVEGSEIHEFVRPQAPVIRIRSLGDSQEYALPFKPGAFDWPAGTFQQVSLPSEPFKVALKAYYPASIGKLVHEPAEGGSPMLRLRPMVKPPGSPQLQAALAPEEEWFTIPGSSRLNRITRRAGPARFAFLYVDRPELVDDFLHPPDNPGRLGVARLRYADRSGQPRVHDFRIDDGQPNQPIQLPDSDLWLTFLGAEEGTVEELAEALGGSEISTVKFNVRKGDGPEVLHFAIAGLPMLPPVIPRGTARETPATHLTIDYHRPPRLGGAGMGGTFGVVEVMGDPQGRLAYRVFGRDETPLPPGEKSMPRPGVLKSTGRLEKHEPITAFGGNPNLPMTLSFRAEDYLVSGVKKMVYQPFDMPVGKKGQGRSAVLAEMTVDGETKEFWLRQPELLDPSYQRVHFKAGDFDVAYHYDRKDLGFNLKLKNFEVGFDPGTKTPSTYTSEVALSDAAKGLKDKPVTITMNQPLTHGQYTLYQSSYQKVEDPRTGRANGEFMSVFQVGHDAGRFLKYLGCGVLVCGIFLQFTMKAGVFSGNHTVAGSADKARRLLARKAAGTSASSAKSPGKAKGKPKKTKNFDDAIL